MLSLPIVMFVLSRRISLATSVSGSLSQLRNETYTLSSSKLIHTSVFSVAGEPLRGST